MALTRELALEMILSAQDRLFEDIDERANGLAPSQVKKLLDQAAHGWGDDYREWFEQGDEEWS